MSDSSHTGPINPYGDLSRRARRALEAQGINPDEALAKYNETGDIGVLTGAIPIVPVADVSEPVVEEQVDGSEGTVVAETESVEPESVEPEPIELEAQSAPTLFPSTFSRRDKNLIEQRVTAEIEVVDSAPASVVETTDDSESATVAEPESTPEPDLADDDIAEGVADIDSLMAVVDQDEDIIDVVSEAPEVTSQDIEPVPFDGGPLADVEEVIAIDRSEDTESTISEYEAFQITTTSTGVIPTTGHTLVLPTLPEEDPNVIAALNSTGEIVITGQITLPLGIAATTDSNALDGIDLDGPVEPELVTSSNDLAPVSATAAVSSIAGPTGVATPVKRRSEKLPVILAVSAAILAAGVVALFVANLFIPVFK